MRRTDWRAFVPTPKKAEEWTREMDFAIAQAVEEWESSVFVQFVFSDPPPELKLVYPHYSTDLAAVVRAAEKWCDMHGSDRGWYVHRASKQAHRDCQYEAAAGGDMVLARTPALALAKALYAAIRAEGEKTKLASHCISAKQIDEAAVRNLGSYFGKWRGQG